MRNSSKTETAIVESFRVDEPRHPNERVLTPREAGGFLGVSVRTLDQWRYREQGPPYVMFRRLVWYRFSDLDEYKKGKVHQPSPAPMLYMLRSEKDSELDELVKERVAEVVAQKKEFLFEPWFQTQKVADELQRLQSVPQRKKWSFFFDDWGCLICGTKERAHRSLGMCGKCFERVYFRLGASIRRRSRGRVHQIFAFDMELQAREALSIGRKALLAPAQEEPNGKK